MTDASVEGTGRPTHRLTPDRVRRMQFTRTPIGRRGVSEQEVEQFLERVAEEIAARDAAEASLRAKAMHYKNTLVQWQREHTESRSDEAALAAEAAARPTVDAVNILSQAQQEADAYLAQTQEYCRRLAADAEEHALEVMADARTRSAETAGDDRHGGREADRTSNGVAAQLDELERRLTWARSFIASLEAVESQLRTAREALTYEFDRISSP
jgi:DivIVA domain-containing protein